MGSLDPDAPPKQELDDSGYVQDDAKPPLEEYKGTAELLDLSDDVLLYIFKRCSPQDLKALGFSCARLGALVLDRTLWVDVDACSAPLGRRRVRWLLTRALGPHTKRLRLKGYAEEADGCLGYANQRLPENASGRAPQEEERYLCGGPRVYRLTQSMPRFGNGAPSAAPSKCVGPRLTFTHTALRALGERCPELSVLELEHCVIDCQTTNIGLFPKTLKKLSLRGTKCFNLEAKSFLFKIQDHLLELEELDVSYCSWIEPACMLPLSKMPKLKSLSMRECHKLAEFVAYASLATRYGFKQLEHLDLRGSPVGDSEVSALGWLPRLSSLKLSPAPASPRNSDHAHYAQDLLPADKELEEWEEKEPDYFKPPSISEAEWTRDEDDVRANQARYYSNCEDPTACILLERMIAEPVNPDEYSQVYHQFLAGHNNNVPLANPDEYRESYRQFMVRPTRGHPPAGYSLFIRKAEPEPEAGPSKRCEHSEGDSKPGTSIQDSSTSKSSPDKTKSEKLDSDSSDSKEETTKRRTRWGPEKRNDSDTDSDGPRKKHKKDDDRKQPRRVFEITINELNRGQYENQVRNDENEAKRETRRHQSCQTVDLIPCDAGTLVVDSVMQTDHFRPTHRRHRSNSNKFDAKNIPQRSKSTKNDGSRRSEDGSKRADEPGSSRSHGGSRRADSRRSNENGSRAEPGGSRSEETGSRRSEDGIADEAGSSRSDEPGSSRQSDQADTKRAHEGSNESGTSRSLEAGSRRSDEAGSSKMSDDTGSGRSNEYIPDEPGTSKRSHNRTDAVGGSKRSEEAESSRRSTEYRSNEAGSSKSTYEPSTSRKYDEVGSKRSHEERRSSSKRSHESSSRKSDRFDESGTSKRSHERRSNEAGSSRSDEPSSSKRSHESGSKRSDEPGSSKRSHDSSRDESGSRRSEDSGSKSSENSGSKSSENSGSKRSDDTRNERRERRNDRRIFQFRQYRRPIVIEEFINVGDSENPGVLPRGVLFPGCPTRLDPSALVSDSSIRRFGRAIGENINYIHIGGGRQTNARPDRSSLTDLTVTGFRHVTDASLTHLATAAPLLQRLDVRGTRVTLVAVERFKALRPDVEVISDAK